MKYVKFLVCNYSIIMYGVACSSESIIAPTESENVPLVIPSSMLESTLKSMHKYPPTVAPLIKSLTIEQKIVFAKQILNACDWNDIFFNWSITQYYSSGSLFKSKVIPKLIIEDREIRNIIKHIVSSKPNFNASAQEDNFMLLFIMNEYLPYHTHDQKAWDMLDCFFYIEEEEIPFNSFIFEHLRRKKMTFSSRMKLLEKYQSHGFEHLYQFMYSEKSR